MELVEKIKNLQKKTEKELKNKESYQEMKEAFLILEEAGVTKEPTYNLQTIENIGIVNPVFSNPKNT